MIDVKSNCKHNTTWYSPNKMLVRTDRRYYNDRITTQTTKNNIKHVEHFLLDTNAH